MFYRPEFADYSLTSSFLQVPPLNGCSRPRLTLPTAKYVVLTMPFSQKKHTTECELVVCRRRYANQSHNCRILGLKTHQLKISHNLCSQLNELLFALHCITAHSTHWRFRLFFFFFLSSSFLRNSPASIANGSAIIKIIIFPIVDFISP